MNSKTRVIFRSVLLLFLLLLLYFYFKPVPDNLRNFEKFFSKNSGATGGKSVTATYFGVSSILISDGKTNLMIDGFFSRPRFLKSLFGKISPDLDEIGKVLERAKITKLDAVFSVHSHHDHAMDSPVVARLTWAFLFGSESTRNIALGLGFEKEKFRLYEPGKEIKFGDFGIIPIRTNHYPFTGFLGKKLEGEISAPLVPPVGMFEYKEGGSFDLYIRHPTGIILVHSSAGLPKADLSSYPADVVFLGIGGLSKQTEEYRSEYFSKIVMATRSKRIIPVHWDNFFLSLDQPLVAQTGFLDDGKKSIEYIIGAAQKANILLQMLQSFDSIVLF